MNISEMKEQRAKLLQNVSVIISGADEEGRPLTDDEAAQVDQMMGQADDLQAEADTAERKLKLAEAQNSLKVSTRKVPTVPATVKRMTSKEERQTYQPEVFRQWLLHGTRGFNPSAEVFRAAENMGVDFGSKRFEFELRTQTKGTNSAGGYTVPQDFGDKVIQYLKYFCQVRDFATVITTENGQSLPFPTNDDVTNLAAITAENSAVSATDTTFGQTSLSAYNYKTLMSISIELLQDSKFNLEDFLASKMGERIGRAQEVDFVTGDGSSKPTGIVYSATNAVSNWTTTYANLVSLFYSVDIAYRSKAIWLMHDQTAAGIRGLVDDVGRPLWNMMSAFDGGTIDTLFGRPVIISNSMDYSGTSKKVIVFGDPTDFYVRDVGSVEIVKSTERYFEYQLVAFLAYLRSDSKWLGSSRALKCGTTAA